MGALSCIYRCVQSSETSNLVMVRKRKKCVLTNTISDLFHTTTFSCFSLYFIKLLSGLETNDPPLPYTLIFMYRVFFQHPLPARKYTERDSTISNSSKIFSFYIFSFTICHNCFLRIIRLQHVSPT